MDPERRLPPRLIAIFAAGCLLFGYPLLGLFSRAVDNHGFALLYVYLFIVWGVLIAAIAWLLEGRGGVGR